MIAAGVLFQHPAAIEVSTRGPSTLCLGSLLVQLQPVRTSLKTVQFAWRGLRKARRSESCRIADMGIMLSALMRGSRPTRRARPVAGFWWCLLLPSAGSVGGALVVPLRARRWPWLQGLVELEVGFLFVFVNKRFWMSFISNQCSSSISFEIKF